MVPERQRDPGCHSQHLHVVQYAGFCERGEGGPFTDDGGIEWPHGRLPVNTSGGGMSEAYVHGFNLILEGVRQIRGTSTAQVDGADVSLVTSGEGVPTSAIVFVREA